MEDWFRKQPLIHLLGPLIVGVSFLITALCLSVATAFFLWRSTAAEGRVVRLERQESAVSTGEDSSQTFFVFVPEFVFLASDGKEYTVRAKRGSNPSGYAVGQGVRVFYRRGDPAGASIASFGQLWGSSCGFAAGGSVLTGVGWILLQWGRSRRRRGLRITNS